MANQNKLDGTYMQVALVHAKLSKAIRAKVGACIVTKNGVILAGYNGTPSGWDNMCEHIVEIPKDAPHYDHDYSTHELKTKPEVLHAELNCIMKAAREGVSVQGSTLYVTLQPCVQCSAMIAQAGIIRVVYGDVYRDTSGVDMLQANGIIIEQFDKGETNEGYI